MYMYMHDKKLIIRTHLPVALYLFVIAVTMVTTSAAYWPWKP